jgi:hypothetical protein
MDRCEGDVIVACGLYLLVKEEKQKKKKNVNTGFGQSVLESQGIKNQHSFVRSGRTTSNQDSWLCNFGNNELLKEQSGL